ncbi:unnamed protein product [Calypogeia fissa]
MGFQMQTLQRPTCFGHLLPNRMWVLVTLLSLGFLPGVTLSGLEKAPYRMHTLFSVECSPYFDWQTVGLMHSFRKAKQPGPITRLLSCTDEGLKNYKNLDIAPTHVVPSMTVHPITGDVYAAINKPAGVLHWLTHSQNAKLVDWVVILDADMVMRRPMIPWELGVRKGHPLAAYYGYLVGCESTAVLALAHTRHPELCDKVGGFLLHHVDDLQALAPLWLSKTEEVRADKEHYATKFTGDIYEHGWISEMYGYSFAAAEIGLRHQIDNDIMIYPGYIPGKDVDPLLMHYGIRFNVSSWYFAKSEHRQDAIVEDCNRLFPAPPYPNEVPSITADRGQRRADYLSIACMNTINEGLLLHHEKRGCPQPRITEYLEFLRAGLAESLSAAHTSTISVQEKVASGEGILYNTETKSHHQNPKMHTLFSTECTDYFDWQTLGIYHSFLLSGQPGRITRLLSCSDEALKTYKNMDLAPTHLVPSYSVHPLTGDEYPAFNKPAAVYHWLSHVQLDVEYVVILDADMVLRRPITPWELGASKGHPVSAAYDYLIGCDTMLAQLHTEHPEYCQKVGGVIVMHIDDLRLLAPLWLHKTEEVRADRGHWATNLTGDIYGNGWISEMYGYLFGAAELKLKHTINKTMMLYPGYFPPDTGGPLVLHYGLGFNISNWRWDKQTWRFQDMTSTCWKMFPFPPVPEPLKYSSIKEYDRDVLSFECMKTLNEALFLYHKRKGCKHDENLQKNQIFDGQGTMHKGSKTQTSVDGMNANGNVEVDHAAFKVGSGGGVVKETEVQTVNQKLHVDGSKQPRDTAMNPKLWMISIWGSIGVLVMLTLSASCSRRQTKRYKERIV